MDLSFTDEQVMLRDTITRYLREDYDFDTRRDRLGSKSYDARLWADLASTLGVLGASLPEDRGGLGGGPLETMIIQEALGASLVVEPFLETVVIGGGLLRRLGGERAGSLLAGIVQGSVRIGFAAAERQASVALHHARTRAARSGDGWRLSGAKSVVVGAADATHWIILARTGGEPGQRDGLSLFLASPDLPGVKRHDYRLIDGRAASDLTFDDVALPEFALLGEEGAVFPIVEGVMDEALVALCAEAVGVLRRMLDDTLAYAKQRKQFGQPLGRFQVLQHRMVDMFMSLEEASAATLLATLRLEAHPVSRAMAASAAKVTIARSARFIGQNAVQLHGAIGLMDELAVGHYFKRATVIENQFGSLDYHRSRYASLSRTRPPSLSRQA